MSIKLVPFTLELFRKSSSLLNNIVTRSGEFVDQLTEFQITNGNYCLTGVVNGTLLFWTKDGKYLSFPDKDLPSNFDLFIYVDD